MCKRETVQNTQANTQNMRVSTIYSAWQNMPKRATTFMPSIVGWGWQWLPKVGMYGWGYELSDVRAQWVTRIGLREAQVVVANEVQDLPYRQNLGKRHSKVGDGKVGQRSHACAVDIIVGLKGPIKQKERGKEGNRQAASQSDQSKNPEALMHKCINTNTKNEVRTPQKKKENKQKNATITAFNYPLSKTTNTQKKENKTLVQQQKQHGQNQTNNKRNENSSTVCVRKNATREKKTQGKKKTTEKIILNGK